MITNLRICLIVVFLVVTTCIAVRDYNELNLVQINVSMYVYKRLMVSNNSILSATPLAILDEATLKNYYCYKSIRTNLWSLGIPVIFWNDTYMQRITDGIKSLNMLKKFGSTISVLPPSGIVAYRLNWRRQFFDSNKVNNISIDSSWQDAQIDYVLPMRHSFIMEFNAGSLSKQLCADTKYNILNSSLQINELTVDFQLTMNKIDKFPDIQIKIKDLQSVKMYNQSECRHKKEGTCFVSKDFAEKWAYDVSVKVMESMKMNHLSVQKDIFDSIFEYLCQEKVPIFKIEMKIVRKLSGSVDDEVACKVPNNLYVLRIQPCLLNPNRKLTCDGNLCNLICATKYYDDTNEIVSKLNPFHSFIEKSQFSIPILKI